MSTTNQPAHTVDGATESDEGSESDEDLKLALRDFSQTLSDFPDIIHFLHKCRDRIKRQNDNIKKLKNKLMRLVKQQDSCKLRKNLVDAETQTNHWDKSQSYLQDWNANGKGRTVSIVEQVKEVAESALQRDGFVYEETSGLYYDYNTGYYYDAKLGLYYDGNLGTYYYYDDESKSYKFHSQTRVEVATVQQEDFKRKVKRKCRKSIKNEVNKNKLARIGDNSNEPEEGECSDSNDSQSSQVFSSNESTINDSDNEDKKDLAKIYPPCMRIVVKETDLLKLKLGTLFIVPYTGGSIGREGNHSVLIQDINISKHHAKFQYNEEKKQYEIIDLGSTNGTILNNTRLSVTKRESDPHEVIHGSIVQVGSTKLLCHIHSGYETCENCEPGLLQCNSNIEDISIPKMKQHKSELRRLKTKFGVEKDNAVEASQVAEGYQDRAQARRLLIGSSDHHAKTQHSSLDTSIAKDNKGFKLLSKMGWSEGQSLGKDGEGSIEPVPLIHSHSKLGLGFAIADSTSCEINSCTKKKQALWRKTQQRYSEISN